MPEEIDNQEIIDDQDIHVMPSLESEELPLNPPKPSPNYKLWIGIVVALLLAIAIGAGVYFLFFANKQSQPEVNNNQPQQQIIDIDPMLEATTTPTSTDETASSSVDLLSVDGRDQQRLMDIQVLRMALEQYYRTQSQFPYELAALLDGYVTGLPKEPSADGTSKSYSYIVDANRLDFKIVFTIEGEPNYFSVRLSPGKYYASRGSILPYQDDGLGNLPPDGTTNPPLAQFKFSMTPPPMGLDTDGDGLTDIEENVWGTKSDIVDSDGDAYKDRDELFNFFDPAVPKQRLLDGSTAAVYKNSNYNYSVIYPSAFTVRALSNENDQIIFNEANGAFFNVIVLDNPANLSTYNWYSTNNSTISLTNFRTFTVDSFPALQTPDGLITYVAVGDKVFVISYNLGTINQANYVSTYRLFLKSFMFGEVIDEPSGQTTGTTGTVSTSTPME